MAQENLDLQNYLIEIISKNVDELVLKESYELEVLDYRDIHRDILGAWKKLDELGWDFEIMLKRRVNNEATE